MDSSPVFFHEKQKFTQRWLWALLLLFLAIFIWGIIQQIILGKPWGENPMSNIGLLLVTLVPLGLIWFFRYLEMETRITDDAIHINYSPIAKKTLQWKNIEKAEIIRYGFVGFGLRLSIKYGTVFNVKGNQGLQLQLKSGRKILIGTQQPETLGEVAQRFMGS